MIRIGKISYWHVHAWDYTKQAEAHPGAEIVAVWDENPERGQEAADKQGVTFYASLDEMLSRDDIDGVIVDAPTNMHREVMIKAAEAGKHIFTEKVIAATLSEVNDIIAAVEKNNVKLTVSLPRLNDGYTLAIRELLDQELLGKVTYVRVRLSHNGATANWLPAHFYKKEETLGGALIDLGCHPMYLTRLFLREEPVDVSAQFGYITGKEVEDNAVATLSTKSGAVGVVEAGFVNNFSPFTVEVHGTEGTILFGTPDSKLLLRTTRNEEYKDAWVEIPVPANRESAFEQWISHIEQGTTADENIAMAIELTKLMEAANLSNAERRAVKLNELQG
ncbi:Gfo/Idh/MocA family protein [Paenibacillus cellulositrophicus]|jgi:predicted dehydrogenase|uniref:Oxidoreductase n=2 Tax=Paenibacillus TaxID=44249 RepID=A0A1R1F1W3_9BACL|nr:MULTISPECIES: Gfo/Idh/MocA family oxidoreductase [Paenibacillus]MEC0173724.1 Gfo/Idh/MocA family oxidoreductase [Paenibacillus favisporus]OMF58074.1 oxidoreductase [Paenibacillus rhizosphaerae]RED40986.1 putative dehydrogenase [Paenibacillus sp. VMFN-D1]GIO60689.1 dehydrogenase [Paenibacillus cineris]